MDDLMCRIRQLGKLKMKKYWIQRPNPKSLSYRPARLYRPAGRYNNLFPEWTISPSQGLRIWPAILHRLAARYINPIPRVIYIPQSGTKNLATAKHAYISQLEEVWHEIFDFRFFMNQFPPGPWVFKLGLFQICRKIRGDIHNFMFITSSV